MDTQRQTRQSESDAEIRVGWKMGGLGMEVAALVAAGAGLGWLYDRWRGTGSTGMLVGSVLGIAVGLWSLIGGALKLNRQLDRQSPIAGRGKPLPPDDDDDKDDWDDDWNRR
jgi:F0F1-type ATP synthase assembly protein I